MPSLEAQAIAGISFSDEFGSDSAFPFPFLSYLIDTIPKLLRSRSAVSPGIFIKITDAPLGRDKYHKILNDRKWTIGSTHKYLVVPFRNSRSVNVQPLNSVNHIVFFSLQFTRIFSFFFFYTRWIFYRTYPLLKSRSFVSHLYFVAYKLVLSCKSYKHDFPFVTLSNI